MRVIQALKVTQPYCVVTCVQAASKSKWIQTSCAVPLVEPLESEMPPVDELLEPVDALLAVDPVAVVPAVLLLLESPAAPVVEPLDALGRSAVVPPLEPAVSPHEDSRCKQAPTASHVWNAVQVAHIAPALPQAESAPPTWQTPLASQHPSAHVAGPQGCAHAARPADVTSKTRRMKRFVNMVDLAGAMALRL